MRKRLGSSYVDAVRLAYHHLSGEIDFVTYWWSRCAERVADGRLRSFGLITTKTLAQSSNRPVLRQHLDPDYHGSLCLNFAVPNHPWHDTETTAAVRIAMTTAVIGPGLGQLLTVSSERRRKGETYLEFSERRGVINVDLSIGPNVAGAKRLKGNAGLCWMGVKMSGDGFKITEAERTKFEASGVVVSRLPLVIAGSDVTERQTLIYALDFHDIETAEELQARYPEAYQYLFNHVKPERDQYRINWWRFAETRPRLRHSIAGLDRYIVTSETSSHRFFVFVDPPLQRPRSHARGSPADPAGARHSRSRARDADPPAS
jgi:hypothetical protein